MSYRTDTNATYDRTLLSNVPDPTRAEKQEGYNVDLLDDGRDRSGPTPPDNLPSEQHPLAPADGYSPGAVALARKQGQLEKGGEAAALRKSPWYRTRWGITAILIAILVIIGGAVGGAVGGSQHHSHNNSANTGGGSGNTSTSESSATGGGGGGGGGNGGSITSAGPGITGGPLTGSSLTATTTESLTESLNNSPLTTSQTATGTAAANTAANSQSAGNNRPPAPVVSGGV